MIAKAESRRLPQKNRQPFHGRPMFHWNLMKLVHLLPGRVYFDSDSEEMLNEAEALGAIPLERPAHLRGHEVASVPLFQNIVRSIDETPEAIVNVQANSPSCRLAVIEKAVRIMQHTACNELLTSYPKTHTINGSVWGFSRERLMAYGDPRVHHPDVLVTDASLDVHTQKELAAAKEEFEMPSFFSK
jgi:CMP-N-acetylneuraminic acid synthetase